VRHERKPDPCRRQPIACAAQPLSRCRQQPAVVAQQPVATYESERHEASQRAAISTIRTRGYSLGSEQDFDVHLEAALKRLAREDSDVRGLTVAMMVADKIRNYAGTAEEHGSDEPVNYIVGPVFGPDERVIMSFNLYGAPGQIRRRDVDGYAAELLKTTGRVTSAVRGVAPSALANVGVS
jgi:hypothetical protein